MPISTKFWRVPDFVKTKLPALTTREYTSVKKPLPKPPVPELNKTLDRYLEYASVVAAGQGRSLAKTHEAVERFRVSGVAVQEKLQCLAEKTKNWVTPIWLSEMYLKVRVPLPVNSSPAYIFPQQTFINMEDQIRYASYMVRGIVDFKDKIDRKEIEREISTGKQKVKMCMDQYDRVLSTYRMPNEGEDVQLSRPSRLHDNEHIVVMCNNQAFVVMVRTGGHLLSVTDIMHQFTEVVRRASNRPSEIVVPLAAGSAGDRERAGRFWRKMSEVETNVKSLSWMQNAMFIVCIDQEDEQKFGKGTEKDLITRGRHILTGFGSQRFGLNRWYDSTIQLVVSSCGTNGLCIEHSTAEGIVIINMAEYALKFTEENIKKRIIAPKDRQLSPKVLTWHVNGAAREMLDEQVREFDELSDELDLEVLIFNDFGKDFIKKCGVSPDGFVQLSMQLAHFQTHGYLVSTYESATHRRFGGGRVDNIRANTHEALEWVTGLENPKLSKEEKVALFRKAAEKQALVTLENVTGYGIDNHLCALNVLAREDAQRGRKMAEIFENPLWADVMRFPLSTSQVTTSPSLPKHDCYLCYGAVVRDGYGCSYNIQPDHIIFAPSAFKSNPRTDLPKFKLALSDSLRRMREMLTN